MKNSNETIFFFLPIVILSFVKMKENSEMEFMFPTETTEKKSRGPTIISSRAERFIGFSLTFTLLPIQQEVEKLFKMGVSKKIGYRH